jgi:hypothetical protein
MLLPVVDTSISCVSCVAISCCLSLAAQDFEEVMRVIYSVVLGVQVKALLFRVLEGFSSCWLLLVSYTMRDMCLPIS